MPEPKRTPETREAFIAALSECGNVTRACEAAGISRMTAYAWRKDDLDFANAWDAALELGAEGLEDEARRRAFEGVEDVVLDKDGNVRQVVRKYSDTLLIFLLKGAKPEKYRERRENVTTMTHQGPDGGPVQVAAPAIVNLTIGGKAQEGGD